MLHLTTGRKGKDGKKQSIWFPTNALDTLAEQSPKSCAYRSIAAMFLDLSLACDVVV